ncbi:MAG TPA: glycosyltransferase family 1 protein [Burkholderiales bacterium]|nr:glycosyltransferase family 1 protein [Burkholderiales bacterium]
MTCILLNLLAATDGAQVTRAKAFLSRFASHAPACRLVVLKDREAFRLEPQDGLVVIERCVSRGRLKALRRMAWECVALPRLMSAYQCDIYLTFSHFLPWSLGKATLSVVGVSNLAPFSAAAWEAEHGLLPKLKLLLLKHSIVSSARRASRVIALSTTGLKTLIEHGVPAAKITVLPNGVEPVGSDGRIGADELLRARGVVGPYILYVSHFYRYKNFLRLVEAYARLEPGIRREYRLVLVGKPLVKGYFDEVSSRIRALQLTDRVVVVPGMDAAELAAVYSQASLFVYPSLIENSPMILLEAMAHGLPIVAGLAAPMPEFAGDAAVYFDPLSTDALATAISETLGDEARMRLMRQRSLARSRTFSWDTFYAGVLEACSADQARAIAA